MGCRVAPRQTNPGAGHDPAVKLAFEFFEKARAARASEGLKYRGPETGEKGG